MKCHKQELGILARRKIEAEIIKPVYDILKRELGIELAQKYIGEAIEQAAVQAGAEFAAGEAGKLICGVLLICNIYGKRTTRWKSGLLRMMTKNIITM